MAKNSVHLEERFHGKPRSFHYDVSIEPRMSDGLAMSGEGGDDMFGTGIAGNLSFLCSSDTIERATVAVICESIVSETGDLHTCSELFTWRHDRWISSGEYFLDRLDRMNPSEAQKLRSLLDQLHGESANRIERKR